MIRDVGGIIGTDAGDGRTTNQDDNPFDSDYVANRIIEELRKHGFTHGVEYITLVVPNIVDISYGRSVGYTFTRHDLGEDIHNISATAIRKDMRTRGEIE